MNSETFIAVRDLIETQTQYTNALKSEPSSSRTVRLFVSELSSSANCQM
jgi:hypothetical protein